MRAKPSQPILVAEDDPEDRHLIGEAVCAAGIPNPLEFAENGALAIERLKKKPRPCLVILDLKMPRVDGFETLRWIRASPHGAALPVIMLSGSALSGDIDEAARLCANAFLVKPASHFELVAMARAIKDFWLGFHESPPSLSS